MVAMNFRASDFDPSTGTQDIFETGEYLFNIVKSDTVTTRDKNGTMLVLTAVCLEPDQRGKRIDIRLNVVNNSPEAVNIAMRELSAISYCAYLTGPTRNSSTGALSVCALKKVLTRTIKVKRNRTTLLEPIWMRVVTRRPLVHPLR